MKRKKVGVDDPAPGRETGAMSQVTSLVDVLIPAYNAAETIEASIASIQKQTITDVRIVVVDDGSTDATGAILQRLAGQDSRITILSTENNGIVDALNTGLGICTARYLARMDSDDLAFSDRFARQLTYLEDNADCVAVGGNVWHIDESGARTGTRTFFTSEVRSDPHSAPSGEPYIMHPFLMVRTAAMQAVGGYRYVFHAEDTDLYWRLAHLGRLHNLQDILGEYRFHDKSISGGSVLNGRISATNSQLSALSERRRRAGKPDIPFPKSALVDYKAAGEIERIIAVAARHLSKSEVAWLEIAVAAKLLQLVAYRPYTLTRQDKKFIKAAVARHHRLLSGENRVHLLLRSILGYRLKRYRFRELVELAPPGALGAAFVHLPTVAARLLAARLRGSAG